MAMAPTYKISCETFLGKPEPTRDSSAEWSSAYSKKSPAILWDLQKPQGPTHTCSAECALLCQSRYMKQFPRESSVAGEVRWNALTSPSFPPRITASVACDPYQAGVCSYWLQTLDRKLKCRPGGFIHFSSRVRIIPFARWHAEGSCIFAYTVAAELGETAVSSPSYHLSQPQQLPVKSSQCSGGTSGSPGPVNMSYFGKMGCLLKFSHPWLNTCYFFRVFNHNISTYASVCVYKSLWAHTYARVCICGAGDKQVFSPSWEMLASSFSRTLRRNLFFFF